MQINENSVRLFLYNLFQFIQLQVHFGVSFEIQMQ